MLNPLPTADSHPGLPAGWRRTSQVSLTFPQRQHHPALSQSSEQCGSVLRGPPAGLRRQGCEPPQWSPLQGWMESVPSILLGRSSSRNKPRSAHSPLPQGGACDLEDSLYLLGTQVGSPGSLVPQAPGNETVTVITSCLPVSTL